jgi:hypothetical protein
MNQMNQFNQTGQMQNQQFGQQQANAMSLANAQAFNTSNQQYYRPGQGVTNQPSDLFGDFLSSDMGGQALDYILGE